MELFWSQESSLLCQLLGFMVTPPGRAGYGRLGWAAGLKREVWGLGPGWG